MSIISKLFKNIFGKNKQESIPVKPANDFWAIREKERETRMKSVETKLKSWILTIVQEKDGLDFTWDSGNDEAFVRFSDATEEEENYQELEEYIIDKLEIPDAGEFQMRGQGTIYVAGNILRAKYSSTMKGIIDYDEVTEEEVYSEEEQDSGDKILFEF